jgi:hypothetical protein
MLARSERPKDDGAAESCEGDEGDHPRKPGGAEDRAGNQERSDRSGVVELDRGLVRDLREHVRDQLRERRDEDERRGEEKPRERQRELE